MGGHLIAQCITQIIEGDINTINSLISVSHKSTLLTRHPLTRQRTSVFHITRRVIYNSVKYVVDLALSQDWKANAEMLLPDRSKTYFYQNAVLFSAYM